MLCGKRLPWSWKLMDSVSATLHNLFSDSDRRTQGAVQHTEQEKFPLCHPDNTFSYERLQQSFLVLESIHVPVQEKHHLSFTNPCVCQISNTSTTHLLPNVSKVGHDEFLCRRFRSDSSSSMYALYELVLHTETLFRSFVHHFNTALSQINIFAGGFVRRCFSKQQLPRRGSTVSM